MPTPKPAQESLQIPILYRDRGTATTDFPAAKAIVCNKADADLLVKLSGMRTGIVRHFIKGVEYQGEFTSVLKSDGTALADGDVTIIY